MKTKTNVPLSQLRLEWVSTGPNHATGVIGRLRVDIHNHSTSPWFVCDISDDKTGERVYYRDGFLQKEAALAAAKSWLNANPREVR